MMKKKPQKGTLNWCVKQADAYGVSYGEYMADYYKRDMEEKSDEPLPELRAEMNGGRSKK